MTSSADDAVRVDDAALARAIAQEAGRALLELRAGALDGAALRAAGDAAAHAVIERRLREDRPNDVVLSEEGRDPGSRDPVVRALAHRVWIVDPLDGTREFAERPRTDWAVHVALWADGDLVAGAVTLPAENLTWSTERPPVIPDRAPGPLRVAVSRSRPPAFVAPLVAELGAVTVPLGSAGAKCAAVWLGVADVYVHAGGQFEWDSAAPVAVARAAGLHTSRIDGSTLHYNGADAWLPDLVVCRPEFAGVVLAAAARHATGVGA